MSVALICIPNVTHSYPPSLPHLLPRPLPSSIPSRCITRSNPAAWETMTSAKSRILDIVRTPEGILASGVRLAAIKFAQRAVILQSRGTSSNAPADPRRRQQQAASADPSDASLVLCPTNHPFISAPKLEQEGARMAEFLLGMLFQVSG